MRKLAVVAALIVLFGALYVARWKPTLMHGDAARAAASGEGPRAERELARDDDALRATSREELAEREPISASIAAESSEDLRRIKLVGAVVDPDDRPIEGASVTSGGDAATTLADGSFELEVDEPGDALVVPLEATAAARELVRLRVVRRGEMDSHGRELVDAGRIVLRAGGQVSGVLTDAQGRALSLAPLSLDGGVRVRAGWDGRFRFERVGAGTHALLVSGFAPNQPVRSFELEPGQSLELGTLSVACQGFLAGRVEASDGVPVAGARIEDRGALPIQGAASVSSESDGSFWLPLRNPPGTLKVERAGFLPQDDGELRLQRTSSAADVRIVLQRIPQAKFAVLDDASGRPVERFSLWLQPGSLSDAATRIGTYPGGTIELAPDARDREFVIFAPGYAPQVGALAPPSAEPQAVRLARGGSVAGRVVSKSMDGAHVAIERGSTDVPAALGLVRVVPCARDGSFRIEDLATGIYRLAARADDGSEAVLEHLQVRAGERLEAGDIHLVAGAALIGHMLLPDAARGENVFVTAQVEQRSKTAMLDEHGAFEIRGLPPGEWRLTVAANGALVRPGWIERYSLAAGETREVTFDLRERTAARLTLSIRTNGEPSPATIVVDLPGELDLYLRAQDDGQASDTVTVTDSVTVRVSTLRGLPLAVRELRIDSADVREEFDVDVGELSVSLAPPAEAWDRVNLAVVAPGESRSVGAAVWLDSKLDSGPIELGPIAIGSYTLVAQFYDLAGGTYDPVAVASTPVQIRRGERALVEFPVPRAAK